MTKSIIDYKNKPVWFPVIFKMKW